MKYQLRPPTVDAFQWQGDIDALNLFLTSINAPTVTLQQTKNVKTIKLRPPSDGFHQPGMLTPDVGDWILWDGIALYSMVNSLFASTYIVVA